MPQPMFVYIMIWSTGMISERPTDGNTSSVPINMLGQLEGDPFGGGQRSGIAHGLSVHWGISSEEVKEVWQAWYVAQPEIVQWQQVTRTFGFRCGHMQTLMGPHQQFSKATLLHTEDEESCYKQTVS